MMIFLLGSGSDHEVACLRWRMAIYIDLASVEALKGNHMTLSFELLRQLIF